MAKHANGTVYGKYIKVKATKNSRSDGVTACTKYISNEEKTALPSDENDTADAPTLSSIDDAGEGISDVEKAIIYAKNDVKVVNPANAQHLITGLNCSPETAVDEFKTAENLYLSHRKEGRTGKRIPNKAYHIILSYKGNNLPPELVHQMGCEFAKRLYGNEYQAVICTHLNTGNYHNHILGNAYSVDGSHKFNDEHYVYKKFWNIANEISLEYGIPVFVNGKSAEKSTEKTRHYKSWKEYSASKEGKSWKQQIVNDLENAIKNNRDYDGVMQEMTENGYEIQHTKTTVSFVKDDVKVRDSRLSYRYTHAGIDEVYAKKKEREEQEKVIDEIAEMRRQIAQESARAFAPVYISRYDEYGNRRSYIIRLLLTILAYVKKGMDQYYSEKLEKEFRDNPNFFNANRKEQMIADTIKIAEKYNIISPEMIDTVIANRYARNAQFRADVNSLDDFLERSEAVLDLIERYQKEIHAIDGTGITADDLTYYPDPDTVAKKRASLNPMTPKMKSVLYKTLHNSNYTLTCGFDHLTNETAKKIIMAVWSERTENLPTGLILGKGKRNYRYPRRNEAPACTKKPVVLKTMTEEEKAPILQLKSTLDALASYGLTTPEAQEKFKREVQEARENSKQATAKSQVCLDDIKQLYKLKKNLNIIAKPIFAYGALYDGSTAYFHRSVDALKAEKNDYDTLLALDEWLHELPEITAETLEKMEIPDPDEYRFLSGLKVLIEEDLIGDINTADPRAVHQAVEKLKADNTLKKRAEKIFASEPDHPKEEKEEEKEETYTHTDTRTYYRGR